MKKLPRKYSYLLWSILGFRLICPVSFQSALSFFGIIKAQTIGNEIGYIPSAIVNGSVPSVNVGVNIVNNAVNKLLPIAKPYSSINPMQMVIVVAAAVWLAGAAMLTVFNILSYIKVKKILNYSEKYESDVYISKGITTPFVFGIVKPKIYIPYGLPDMYIPYILAHERTHIKRRDYIFKLIALAILTLHWFNPAIWLGYKLFVRDLEFSCDEATLISLGANGEIDSEKDRKSYCTALLGVAVKQNNLTCGGLLSFGESSVKTRIKGVLKMKKPTVIISVIAVIAVIIITVVLIANPKNTDESSIPDSSIDTSTADDIDSSDSSSENDSSESDGNVVQGGYEQWKLQFPSAELSLILPESWSVSEEESKGTITGSYSGTYDILRDNEVICTVGVAEFQPYIDDFEGDEFYRAVYSEFLLSSIYSLNEYNPLTVGQNSEAALGRLEYIIDPEAYAGQMPNAPHAWVDVILCFNKEEGLYTNLQFAENVQIPTEQLEQIAQSIMLVAAQEENSEG